MTQLLQQNSPITANKFFRNKKKIFFLKIFKKFQNWYLLNKHQNVYELFSINVAILEVIAEQNAAILRKGSKKTKPAYLKMYTGNNKTSKPDFKTRYVL